LHPKGKTLVAYIDIRGASQVSSPAALCFAIGVALTIGSTVALITSNQAYA
jgi:hypothetical protein